MSMARASEQPNWMDPHPSRNTVIPNRGNGYNIITDFAYSQLERSITEYNATTKTDQYITQQVKKKLTDTNNSVTNLTATKYNVTHPKRTRYNAIATRINNLSQSELSCLNKAIKIAPLLTTSSANRIALIIPSYKSHRRTLYFNYPPVRDAPVPRPITVLIIGLLVSLNIGDVNVDMLDTKIWGACSSLVK